MGMASKKDELLEIVIGEGIDDVLDGFAEGMLSGIIAFVQLSGALSGIDLSDRTSKEYLPGRAWSIPSVRRNIGGRIEAPVSMRGLEFQLQAMVRQIDQLIDALILEFGRGGRMPRRESDDETGQIVQEPFNAQWTVDTEAMGKGIGHLVKLQGEIGHWLAKLPLERRRGIRGQRIQGHSREVMMFLAARVNRQARQLIWLMSRPPRRGWL
jgi:hypothetical protein